MWKWSLITRPSFDPDCAGLALLSWSTSLPRGACLNSLVGFDCPDRAVGAPPGVAQRAGNALISEITKSPSPVAHQAHTWMVPSEWSLASVSSATALLEPQSFCPCPTHLRSRPPWTETGNPLFPVFFSRRWAVPPHRSDHPVGRSGTNILWTRLSRGNHLRLWAMSSGQSFGLSSLKTSNTGPLGWGTLESRYLYNPEETVRL